MDTTLAPPSDRMVVSRSLRHRLRTAPQWSGVAAFLVAMIVVLAIVEPLFATQQNIESVLRGMAVPTLMAAGVTVLLTAGMIDLSIASLLALCGMVLSGTLTLGWPGPACVVATLAFGAAVAGAVNGVLVAKARLSFFIVTLGTMTVFRSVAELPTSGQSVPISSLAGMGFVEWFGEGKVGSVDAPVLLAVGAVLLTGLMMRYTTYGRSLYAVGGNEAAARLSGMRVDRIRIGAFAISGLLVALAAVVLTARSRSAAPGVGAGLEFQAIAAVLLGGSSFLGGSSTVVGTVVGVTFIAVLQNALNLLGIDVFWQGVITGGVLIAAVWLDRVRGSGA